MKAIGSPSAAVALAMVVLVVVMAPAGRAAERDYRIGVDDVLVISVWDNKDLDQVVFVRPDGKISLPLVGEVRAGGRTVAELDRVLTELYGKTIRNAQVMVGVREIKSRSVFFVGGVGKPGPLPLTQDLTLLQAVSLAGGLVPTADLESAYVLRDGTLIRVDFSKLIQGADIQQNITLQPGDTIVVPIAPAVYVQGEVKNPGPLKFTRDLTIVKAISLAGGLTPLAAPKRVTILRGGAKRESFEVNVADLMASQAGKDPPLRPNDVIIVPQRLF